MSSGWRGSHRGGERGPDTFWKKPVSVWEKSLKSTSPIFILRVFLFGALCIPSSKWTGDGQLEGAHFRAGEGEAGGDHVLWPRNQEQRLPRAHSQVPLFLLICRFQCLDSVRVTCTCVLLRRGHGTEPICLSWVAVKDCIFPMQGSTFAFHYVLGA